MRVVHRKLCGYLKRLFQPRGPARVRTLEIGLAQIRTRKVTIEEDRVGKVRAAQVGTAQD
jgi:hypothetical protein